MEQEVFRWKNLGTCTFLTGIHNPKRIQTGLEFLHDADGVDSQFFDEGGFLADADAVFALRCNQFSVSTAIKTQRAFMKPHAHPQVKLTVQVPSISNALSTIR